jgi:predicted small lipoprotein YifL
MKKVFLLAALFLAAAALTGCGHPLDITDDIAAAAVPAAQA